MKGFILIEHYGYAFTSNKNARLIFTSGHYHYVQLF